MRPLDLHSLAGWLRIGVACVWLVFGLVFKAFDVVPRHRQIVARVMGEKLSRPLILFVAAGETGIGLWMLSGHYLPLCVGLQTAAIVAMNTLEIRYARDLLLAPVAMVCANCALLGAGWYAALA